MLNSSSNLYKTEWLDLVFKNRNKNYGAYVLRSESSGTLLRALMIAAPLFISFFVAPMIYRHLKPDAPVGMDQTVVKIMDIPNPIDLKPKEEESQPKSEPIKEKIKMIKLPSRPIVVEHTTVEPPTLKELDNAVVGPVTQEGLETNLQSVSQTGNGNGSVGNGEGSSPVIDNSIHNYETIEAYPEFEGGMKAWARFIQRYLRYPSMAQEIGTQGKVFISFVIEKDGSVSNVTLVKGIGSGCDEEAIRVIKKSPKWKPGRQNDQAVRVRYNMPISFNITQ